MEGKLVRLRAYEREDLDNVMSWVNDPEVTRTLASFPFPMSRGQEAEWLEKAVMNEGDRKVFAIETKEGEYLGGLGFIKIDWKNRNLEFGIVIGKKEHWDKGYGTDATMVALDWAFNRLNMHKVYLRVFDYNKAAIRCYEKYGFKRDGVLREGFYFENRYHDVILMGILKHEFLEMQKKSSDTPRS